MKKIALVLLGVIAVAFPALAIQQLDLNLSGRLDAITSGILIAPQSLNISDSRINANRITRALGASATIDFASATITTVDSAAITVLGARTGDPCFVGPPAAVVVNASFTCIVTATDTVKVRFSPAGTAADPLSGTFNVRVLSNQ
jgi:hypothetical protein